MNQWQKNLGNFWVKNFSKFPKLKKTFPFKVCLTFHGQKLRELRCFCRSTDRRFFMFVPSLGAETNDISRIGKMKNDREFVKKI